MPIVSFITPAHDASRTLPATLDSLLAQTETGWEAIIVDDGSRDATAEIARRYSAADPRIRLARQDQRGAAAARNAAIALASGDWLIFLDADDVLAADHVATMLKHTGQAADADALYCGWRRLRDGQAWWTTHPARLPEGAFTAAARYCPFAIHAVMVRRPLIVELGGFDPTLHICEDWDLWQRLARTGARFVAVDELCVDVRVMRNSLSSQTENHLRHGIRVVARGHDRDPRVVRPAAEFVDGMHADRLPHAIWYLAVWLLGAAIGRGEDLPPLLDLVAPPLPIDADPYQFAAILEDGIVVGAFAAEPIWPALWPEVHGRLRALETALDERSPGVRFGSLLCRSFERKIVEGLDGTQAVTIGRTKLQPVDITRPIANLSLAGVERLRCSVFRGDEGLDTFEQVVFGDLTGAALRPLIEARLPEMRPYTAEDEAGVGGDGFDEVVRAEHARAVASVVATHRKSADGAKRTGPAPDEVPDYAAEAYWEGLFAQVDPWDYKNNYETTKYRQTLALLDGRHFERGLELACAEGIFTQMLAPHVDELVATDISPSAVRRAASTYGHLANVSFGRLDLLSDDLGGPYDLIICSEVLYYVEDPEKLRRLAEKVSIGLKPGGWFVTAHANLLVDEPARTGFGWPHAFGAAGLGEIFDSLPDLSLSAEAKSPLYRIQRFEKVPPGLTLLPSYLPIDTAHPLPLSVATQVRWRGGRQLEAAPDWHDFPILMYHRIAEDGPKRLARYRHSPAAFERQLAFMRDHGWQGMTLARLLDCFQRAAPPPPRSVVLTFDDGTEDFLTHALPLLHRYGFPASLFIPSDKIGSAADWDAAYGEPARLLTSDDLAAIAASDVTIGAHGASHVKLSALSPRELVHELAGAKFALEAKLGTSIFGLAYPYGDFDPAIRDLASTCGYGIGLSCAAGLVSRDADPMALKRQEVYGEIGAASFAALLE